jgi:NADH dehydrogenase (ubiquinone) 1 alpha/beta subcomplex 1
MMMLKNMSKAVCYARPILSAQHRCYRDEKGLMKRVTGKYYSDPMDVAERVVRLISLHDACRDPAQVTPNKTFEEVGLNPLDMVEVFLGCEREFDLEIAEEACEDMRTVNDLIEHLARNPATK